MKAITVCQPFATLIALGIKQIETRSWRKAHDIKTLAIHASFKPSKELLDLCFVRTTTLDGQKDHALKEPYRSLLEPYGLTFLSRFPQGCFVALAEMGEVLETPKSFGNGTYDPVRQLKKHLETFVVKNPELEVQLGDYSLKRFGWCITKISKLKYPIAAKGQLSCWNVTPEDEQLIKKELNQIKQ